VFQPIQLAAVTGLRDCDDAPGEIGKVYQARRDVLIDGLQHAGWRVAPPKASMFTWARIPEAFSGMSSLEFAKLLMKEARLAVSPGIGFGPLGEGFVRFSLIENDERVGQAMGRVGEFLKAREAIHV
jgi:alanine-synthesizing transaminase